MLSFLKCDFMFQNAFAFRANLLVVMWVFCVWDVIVYAESAVDLRAICVVVVDVHVMLLYFTIAFALRANVLFLWICMACLYC